MAAAVLACGGCAAKKNLTAPEYFQTASDNLRRGAYQLAIEQYRELLDQHPFSEYSEEAEFAIAHAHYLRGACPEAVGALTDFQRRHPTSPHLPMVGYLLGKCYEQQMRPPDRDQSASEHAHAYYTAVLQQYPESPFADLARQQMARCRENMARHELLVARFYRRHGNGRACEYRLLDLVNRFGDTDTAAEALYALGKLYRKRGDEELAALAFSGVVREHPTHELAVRAREQLNETEDSAPAPSGDPVVVLAARAGRFRKFALTRAIEVPPLEAATTPGLGPAIGPAQESGPFGPGGTGPLGY